MQFPITHLVNGDAGKRPTDTFETETKDRERVRKGIDLLEHKMYCANINIVVVEQVACEASDLRAGLANVGSISTLNLVVCRMLVDEKQNIGKSDEQDSRPSTEASIPLSSSIYQDHNILKAPGRHCSWDEVRSTTTLERLLMEPSNATNKAGLEATLTSESRAWLHTLPSPNFDTLLDDNSFQIETRIGIKTRPGLESKAETSPESWLTSWSVDMKDVTVRSMPTKPKPRAKAKLNLFANIPISEPRTCRFSQSVTTVLNAERDTTDGLGINKDYNSLLCRRAGGRVVDVVADQVELTTRGHCELGQRAIANCLIFRSYT
ncbi:hypothetical protein EVAR_30470_1 [Eumeta japonica]|uniref:Uncharacterized protein n=1 Tax=Eumeta variegata TaxID=151549 RepID=A0A4C1VXI8_EUMVA|nr:hypothetical protein EVAR_30470_1 [Eumeta japonica]